MSCTVESPELLNSNGHPVTHNQHCCSCPVTPFNELGRLAAVGGHAHGDRTFHLPYQGQIYEFWTATPAAAHRLKASPETYIVSWEDEFLYLRHPHDPEGRCVQKAQRVNTNLGSL